LLVLESERPDAALFQHHLVLCISTGAKFVRHQLHAVHAGASAVLSRGSEWRSEDENDRVSLSLVSLDYDIMQYVFGKEHEYDVSGSGAVLPSGKDEVEDLFEMVHERVPFYFCSENDMLLDH